MKSILKLVLMYNAARYLYNGRKTTLHDQVKEESTRQQGAQSERGKSIDIIILLLLLLLSLWVNHLNVLEFTDTMPIITLVFHL